MKYDNLWTSYPRVPLTDLLSFIVDNRGKTVPTSDSGIALIATNCVTNNTLYPVFEKIRYLSEDTYKNWFRAHPEPGDILFVNKGTPGRVCMVPSPVNFCIAQDMIALRADSKKLYNRFLFAVLRSKEIQTQIYNTNVGDTIPHFKKQFLNQILVPLPDMKIQKFIGDTYFKFSEKIELNNKINANLQQQAQALFKAWFIDFEPWGGVMPEGWREAVLTDIAEYTNGLAMQKFRPNDASDSIPVLKIRELNQGFCDTNSDECSRMKIGTKFHIRDGDVIFSWSGTLLVDIWTGGTCGLNQHLFKVTSDKYDKWFYYKWTQYHLDKFIHLAKSMSTTMGHIKRNELEKSYVLIPTNEDMMKMTSKMKPILDKIISARLENAKLAELRDTLLPKLMSGELDVSDIELSEVSDA